MEASKNNRRGGRSQSHGGGRNAGETPKTPDAPARDFPIVALGASAGGLDALKKFFTRMAEDSGLAFVVVQHLDPHHKSLMAEILGRCTAMPVVQVGGDVTVEPNHVYVAPPGKYLIIEKGVLSLTTPPADRGAGLPIDIFLRALAEERREKAICIILSGTGSDGTLGLRAVKEFGGMAMVQNPDTAAFDSMPSHAVATGQVDFVLPVAKMPDVLRRYIDHSYVSGAPPPQLVTDDLMEIIALLQIRLKRNFRSYKKPTLIRRIERRMGIVHAETVKDYIKILRHDPEELNHLAKDLMISVTRFFRNQDAFDALAAKVIPDLVRNHEPDQPIRIWVPGCATGEEAYSIAILFLEHLSDTQSASGLQVFASDIDIDTLDVARTGIFPENIAADISAERLQRFFVKEGATYRASKQLRECITFAEQDLIGDPPFSRIDLISCRNLLIYVEPDVQQKIIALFSYALVDGGYLFLGSSETIGKSTDQFKPVDRKARIFRRIGTKRPPLDVPISNMWRQTTGSRSLSPDAHVVAKRKTGVIDLAYRLLAESYAPPTVLINRRAEPFFHFGPVDRYLKVPVGEPGQDILAMAREGLRSSLRGVIQSAISTGKTATATGVRVKRNGGGAKVSVSVSPVLEPAEVEGLLLVSFTDEAEPIPDAAAGKIVRPAAEDDSLVTQLELELRATREDLQSTIEEFETANEELKASNEEAMSMNEELQSTNEELETAKEEMQSLNEELSTVNSELQDKIETLEATQNDIRNLLDSTEIATVFLDRDFRIKRFTPSTTQLLNLLPSDTGRPLSDLSPNFVDSNLLRDAESVLAKLVPIEAEVRSNDGAWYIRRVLPYRTQDDRIEGVVITFSDVTRLKRAEMTSSHLATVVTNSNDAIIVHGFDGRILDWNRSAERAYGYSKAEALEKNIRDLVPEPERKRFSRLIERFKSGESVESFETRRLAKDGTETDVWLTATVFRNEVGEPVSVVTFERDVTERKRQMAELKQSITMANYQSEQLAEAKDLAERASQVKSKFLGHMSHELRTPLNAVIGFSEIIREQKLGPVGNPRYVEYANDIFHAGDHLLHMIEDLLDVTKIEAGKFELDEQPLDLNEAVANCFDILAYLAETEEISLHNDLPETFPHIRGDGRRIKQSILNLLSNAVKFTEKGGEVHVGGEEEESGAVAVTIRDNGIGMSKDEVTTALLPFGQVDSSLSRKHHGTGLGLPLVQGMMALHGGTMEISSVKGRGTTVTLRFPPERTLS